MKEKEQKIILSVSGLAIIVLAIIGAYELEKAQANTKLPPTVDVTPEPMKPRLNLKTPSLTPLKTSTSVPLATPEPSKKGTND